MVERRVKRVTLAEVARAAGVSTTTASVVLNGNADALGIREATRASVLATSARLGYRPNRAAQSLGRRRTEVVTLLIQDLANPWFIDLALAARAAASERGYTLNVVGARRLEEELQALDALHDGSSDGVIVASGRHSVRPDAIRMLRRLAERGVPVVLLIDRSPDPAIPALRVDVECGAYNATQHLIGLGHRRIGLLTLAGEGPLASDQSSTGDRFRGYAQALAEAALPFDPAWLVVGDDTLAGGRAMIDELLARPGPRPTAVLVYNDLTATAVLRGLHENGVRVPAEMAVVSFDGTEQAEYTVPSLTTVRHPADDLGRVGVETLFGLLAGDEEPERERMLSPWLIVRESCGGA